jgi:hypothetical protein
MKLNKEIKKTDETIPKVENPPILDKNDNEILDEIWAKMKKGKNLILSVIKKG